MNLLSKNPNAHYDMAHGRPLAIEHDRDGSHIIRFNIKPEMGVKEGETQETQIGWQCQEIRIWDKPTRANIKKAIIRHYVDECDEFAVVNDYNKHVLGVVSDESAVAKYVDFLNFTEDVSTIINSIIN